MATLAILTILITLITTALTGILNGLLSYLLDYTFWKGSIFQAYLPWLAKRILKLHKREDLLYTAECMNEPGASEYLKDEASNYFLFKPLGGCAVCLNVWLALLTFFTTAHFLQIEWYYVFPHVLTSSWMIRKLVGAVYN